MTHQGVTVLREVRTLLAEAYRNDPLLRWISPDDERREEVAAAWLGLFAERYLESGHVDVLGDVDAVALWRMPGDPRDPDGTLPTYEGLLAALVGAEHAAVVGEGLRQLRALVPTQPHVYLHFVAVAPELQGQGLGREVVAPGLERAAEAGLGVHLELTDERVQPFWSALGFAPNGTVELPHGGPTVTVMWRPAP